MIELRTVLDKLLESIHPAVYFQKAPDDAPFPYVVYDLPNSFTNEDQEIFNLDVDVWDNKQDTTDLERLAGMLWKQLNNYSHLDDQIQFSLYRENRLPPIDNDPHIKRRKLIFQLRYFDRRLNDE